MGRRVGYSGRMKVAVVGTYPPRRCGIATFTADVESALREAGVDVMVVPVGPVDGQIHTLSIERDSPRSYERAASALNRSGVDVVLVQHEFGIYGGDAGALVLGFTDALTVPYVVTLHTILTRFSGSQRRVVDELCRGAAAVTVFTSTGRRLLLDQGVIGGRSLRVVPHGAPPELHAQYDPVDARKRFDLPEDGQLLSTFGLLSSGKGIELAIEALAELASQHPNLHYVVAGRTHPDVLRSEGERYRSSLEATAEHLGVRDRVTFVDEFLPVTDIGALLSVTDVFCTPYRGQEQTVSGALTYALAAARPVVSTPYQYARDVLADGAGELSPFDDPAAFAAAINRLVVDGPHRRRALAAAELASMSLDWPAVGRTLASVLSASRHTRIPRYRWSSTRRCGGESPTGRVWIESLPHTGAPQ
jgi:glycosyltransferase involved in cell wall biosynthesis